MTTFPDDFVRLNLTIGTQHVRLVKVGLDWPPPERLFLGPAGELRVARPSDPLENVLVRTSMSTISDEQRAGMRHVARGAEYHYHNA